MVVEYFEIKKVRFISSYNFYRQVPLLSIIFSFSAENVFIVFESECRLQHCDWSTRRWLIWNWQPITSWRGGGATPLSSAPAQRTCITLSGKSTFDLWKSRHILSEIEKSPRSVTDTWWLMWKSEILKGTSHFYWQNINKHFARDRVPLISAIYQQATHYVQLE